MELGPSAMVDCEECGWEGSGRGGCCEVVGGEQLFLSCAWVALVERKFLLFAVIRGETSAAGGREPFGHVDVSWQP